MVRSIGAPLKAAKQLFPQNEIDIILRIIGVNDLDVLVEIASTKRYCSVGILKRYTTRPTINMPTLWTEICCTQFKTSRKKCKMHKNACEILNMQFPDSLSGYEFFFSN